MSRAVLASGENVRVTFQEELDQLEASLQEEGSLVLRVLRGALNALAQRDVELADDVISFDDDVDARYLQIEQEIESLLARQTPVATDLRLVLAMLHVNLHLERMADYSVTIAKLTKLVADVQPDPMLLQSLQEMGERAEEMIRVALDSLANRDLRAAESLVELDELIDRSNRRFVERVVEIVAEPGLREWVLRMVLVSRTLERIGDHAVDIGEQVAYLLTAEFREFTDASHPENA
jgi:phosphate transport system protein